MYSPTNITYIRIPLYHKLSLKMAYTFMSLYCEMAANRGAINWNKYQLTEQQNLL